MPDTPFLDRMRQRIARKELGPLTIKEGLEEICIRVMAEKGVIYVYYAEENGEINTICSQEAEHHRAFDEAIGRVMLKLYGE